MHEEHVTGWSANGSDGTPPGAATWPSGNTFQLLDESEGRLHLGEQRARKGPSGVGRAALAGVLALTVGFGGLAVRSALAEPGGASSPEAAFEAFFAAVDADDLAGVIETMPRNERAALVEPMGEIMVELQRLGVIDDEATASAPGGFDVTVTDLTYTVDRLDPRLAVVTTTGGSLGLADLDLADLPFGDVIDGPMEGLPDEALDAVTMGSNTTDLASSPISLAVIDDDGWHVSMMYSVAEAVRREAGAPFPGLGNGPTPVGAETPEGAVRQLVEEAFALDARGVIAMLDPEEMAVVYDYSPLFLADADTVADRMGAEMAGLRLDRLDTRVIERDGRTMVAVDGGQVSVSMVDPWDGSTQDVVAGFDGGCFELTTDGETQRTCLSDLADEFGLTATPSTSVVPAPQQGVTVVERAGRWYVSTLPSLLRPIVDGLSTMEDDAISGMITGFGDLLGNGLESGLGTSGFAGSSRADLDAIAESIGADPFDGTDPFDETDPLAGFDEFDETEDADFGDSSEVTAIQNFRVLVAIPAGTPSDDLLTGGFIEAFGVPDDEVDFATVWDLEFEIGGLVAGRDIEAGEVLMYDDFVDP